MTDTRKPAEWRAWLYRVFVALFVLSLIGSTAAVWANVRIQESDAWTRTVAPLAGDTVVQAYVVDQALIIIDQQISADEDAGRLDTFSRSQLSGLMRSYLNDFVTSPTFANWWAETNRIAHGTFMRVMDAGDNTVLQPRSGDLVLDLVPIIDYANVQLQMMFPRVGYRIDIAPNRTQIVLYSSEALATTSKIMEQIDALSTVLPIIALVCLAGSLILAFDRLRLGSLQRLA